MLLNIYLGTTAVSFATTFLFSAAYEKKLKRQGYKIVKENKFLLEKFVTFISMAFKCSIPIYNILNSITLLCMGDNAYEYIKNKLLEQGKIYKPINDDCENKILNENTTSIQKRRNEKTYEEMSVEEKLAYLKQEKEKLINETTKNSSTFTKRKK
jgi:hypothetical protein